MKALVWFAMMLCLSAIAFGGPLDPPDPSLEKVLINGKIIQRTADGLLVLCRKTTSVGHHAAEGTVLVRDGEGNDGATFHTMCYRDGTYTYTTILKATKNIDAYKVAK
jgi:hypothetical protein